MLEISVTNITYLLAVLEELEAALEPLVLPLGVVLVSVVLGASFLGDVVSVVLGAPFLGDGLFGAGSLTGVPGGASYEKK